MLEMRIFQWPKQLNAPLEVVDPEIADIIEHEKARQWKVLLLLCVYIYIYILALHSNKTLFSNLTKVKLKFRNLSSNGGGHITLVVNSSLKNRIRLLMYILYSLVPKQ